jgi:hypothetical protein
MDSPYSTATKQTFSTLRDCSAIAVPSANPRQLLASDFRSVPLADMEVDSDNELLTTLAEGGSVNSSVLPFKLCHAPNSTFAKFPLIADMT